MRVRFWRRSRAITMASEYRGESTISIGATQLDGDFTPTRARNIVDDWCSFFRSGTSAITDLTFTTRTPKRLFESLAAQTQLEALRIKWGDYEDLSPLTGMKPLRTLVLGGASSVRTLEPLAGLNEVETLLIEGLKRVRDLAPLARMSGVVDLEVVGDWMSLRVAHVDSIGFLRDMQQLRRLILHTMIADDLDYSPLLALPNVKEMRVMEARGMRPRGSASRARCTYQRSL